MISCEHCMHGAPAWANTERCYAGIEMRGGAEHCPDFDHAAMCAGCVYYDAPTLVCSFLPEPAAWPPAEGHQHPLGCLYREQGE